MLQSTLMGLDRRQFLGRTAGGLAATWAAGRLPAQTPATPPAATLDPARLRPWLVLLPLPPRAQPLAAGLYELSLQASEQRLHPELPPTRLWTYGGSFPGPTLEASSGEPIAVRWRNRLPAAHFLPVDPTLTSGPPVRAVAHVHGARVPAASDGYPEDWSVPGQQQLFHYPNRQEAAPLFYHDHAMGLARLNIYAGLAGFYFVRDALEHELSLPTGAHELPLMLCDRWLTPAGQLFYPTSGIPGHPWVPEVLGNAMLVNGALFPRLPVAPTAYRLRFCNVANSRSFDLSFSEPLPLHVIASDQGLLAAPVTQPSLLLAPAERADVLVDFRPHAGRTLYLCNDGQPMLRCEVAAAAGATQAAWRPPARLRPLPRLAVAAAGRRRLLTLDEFDGFHGLPALMLLDSKRWDAPASETPRLGETEIWQFLNLGDDTHPIHLHQVRFRILDRQSFDADEYLTSGTLRFLALAEAPAPAERGWKDTVRCPAGALTRIIVRFESYAGRYVWHCHILEHEANQMMRPLLILPAV